ncbi:mucin-5AC isoform X1 [Amyelois transitella]|uniref:mucin-5AC isoform X1 n=1 Tax=Amyelois transitella TaxID=680683 RepID=UPI00298F8436|nr:mucin-5AC isoform X1 [Amyelois transitella]XP_060806189.1 mucin-5AC isoform X1 [Amyelois transitella]
MELKCVVVFTFASLLAVKATPHGYGVKGGAMARAEAGAAAGTFGGIGLPLSTQSGPGFSGSFSKSSSSSFASSSASSSSSSFSFSGSGAGGFGLNNLGLTGFGGCLGGCQSDHNKTNNPQGSTGSTGDGLQSGNVVKSSAAAGAFAGSYIDSQDSVHGPCTNDVCPGKKPQCTGLSCKDNKQCTSGKCESKSEPSSPEHKCESGRCSTGSSIENSPYPSIPAYVDANDNRNCASGQCGSQVPSVSTASGISSNVKCSTGKCEDGSPTTPERDYGPNDIPVSITSTSTFSHDSNIFSEAAKKNTITSQVSEDTCKDGRCDSSSPNNKPGYSKSNVFNQNEAQNTKPINGVTPSKPAIDLTAPKEETCIYPNCKSPSTQLEGPKSTTPNLSLEKSHCAGAYCENVVSPKYPTQINSQPQNIPAGIAIPSCNSPSCYSNKDLQTIKHNYTQNQFDQKGNNNIYPTSNCALGNCGNPSNSIPALPKNPDYSQTFSPNTPEKCTTGNCGSRPSYQSGSDINVPGVPLFPSKSSGFNYSPNCASGNCERFPSASGSLKPTIPSYSHKPSSNGNCPYGNCNPSNTFTSQPETPNSQGHVSSAAGKLDSQIPTQQTLTYSPTPTPQSSNCAFGNCGNHPSDQLTTKPSVPSYSPSPFLTGISPCQSGSCNSYPSSHNLDSSSYPRLPSYPQNILPNKPLNCASGNCANYPSSYPLASKFPNLAASSTPDCISGTCGNNPTSHDGSFGSPGYQKPAPFNVPSCPSGNCAFYTSTPTSNVLSSGSHVPPKNNDNNLFSSTGPLSQGGKPTVPNKISAGCAFGNCPSYPTQTILHQAHPTSTNPSNNLPDYVALGTAGGNMKPEPFVPSSIPSTPSQPSSTISHTVSNANAAAGANSQSSIFNAYKPNTNKEQLYTGGFGGPPGILKPFEYTAPSHQLASSSKDQGLSQCSNGICDTQSESSIFGNKHDLPSGITSGSCSSGNCEPKPDVINNGQGNTASGTFAAAAAGSEAIVYTGGFGGPPGILKPYDGGKISNTAAIAGSNHPTAVSLGTFDTPTTSGHKLNNGYGTLSGAVATANSGTFGSGNYGAGYNKASGCDGGCESTGHGSNFGNFALAGGLSKTGLLDKLHNGVNAAGAAAHSVARAISGAGASSFALGGSFASSSASAHSVAGSATKGGYGR